MLLERPTNLIPRTFRYQTPNTTWALCAGLRPCPCCELQQEDVMTDAADGVRDLEAWLAPFLAAMGRKTRRTWAPLYLRGLLGPGERKSLQPMAARLGLAGHDQLHHFVASPAWDDSPLWRALAERADRLVGGPDAVLAIDDTALPKKGELSAG